VISWFRPFNHNHGLTVISLFQSLLFANATCTATPRWNKGAKLRNLVDVHSTEDLVACLHEAANLDRRSGRARLVCVEYFAGWCFACRSLHPKFCKIAAKEFPDVLFVRIHKDELPELCDALGVDKLPYVQMYKGVDGVVDEFAINNSAPNLDKFRRALRAHRDGACHGTRGQAGPATTVHTAGWPEVYTAAHRRSFRRFRQSALSYYRGLPPPGEVDDAGAGEKKKYLVN
jgi:thiol-disulfide isomerase/thioredoxin